jgi:hypothetical protein
MAFPPGPFFNMRLADEMPWWQPFVWMMFGEKKVATVDGITVTAYYFRGVTYVHEVEGL